MAAFGVLLRRGPARTLSALAASVLAAIGGTLAVPGSAAAAELARQHITWTDTADTPLTTGTVSVAAVASSGLPVSYTSASGDVCTADGDVVTLHRQGRCTIRAIQAGNASFAAAEAASSSFAVLGRAQTITWTATPDVSVTAGTVRVSATASSGLAVTYRTATPRTCKVQGGKVTLVAGGTCTVRATQPGNDEYAPAPRADDSFIIGKLAQTIRFPRPADTAMTTGTAHVDAAATSGLPVTVTSRDRSVCTVSARRLTLVGAGTCVLRATQPGNGRYAPAPRVERRFTVGRGGQTIEFPAPGPVPLPAGTVTVTPSASSGLPVTVTSTNLAVCTVAGASSPGLSSSAGSSPGAATTGGSSPGGSSTGDGPSEGSSSGDASVGGSSAPGTAADAPAAGTSTGGSSSGGSSAGNPSTGTSTGGTATGGTAAGTIVTLHTVGTCGATGDWSAAAAVEISFPVVKGTQTITFPPPPTTAAGATVTLRATASSGLPVTYTASTPAVCAVAGAVGGAVVTLRIPGACAVRATQPGDGHWDPAPAVDATFTVTGDAQTITFPTPPTTPLTDETVHVSATATSRLPVAITSNTPKVCTIAGTVVTLRTPGRCTVTATQRGDATHAAAPPVTHTFTVARGAQRITFPQPDTRSVLDGPLTMAPSATSYLPVSVSSSTPAVCTVAGSVRNAAAGSTPNNAPGNAPDDTTDGATAGSALDDTTDGAVADSAPGSARGLTTDGAVTGDVWDAADGAMAGSAPGSAPGLTTDGAVTGDVRDAADGAMADSARGNVAGAVGGALAGTVVTPIAAGECTLHAVQAGNAEWAPARRVTRTVRITAVPQAVTFAAPAPVAVSDGPVGLVAVASSGLPVTFSSGSPDTCSVDGVTVTPLAVGGCVLVAHQGGDRRFAPAPDVTATLAVLQEPAPVTVPAAAPPTHATAGRIVGIDNPAAGEAVTLSGGGFKPGTAVEVVVYSAPQPLGTAYTDAAGAFTLLVVVPADLHRGGHTFVAAGLAGDNSLRLLSAPVTVHHAAATLPVTGGPVGAVAALGGWAVLIGTVLALLGRRGLWQYRWLYRFLYRARHAV
ncbi:hypothetical protein AB0J72_07300 [Dactylosporangium sp. NPDC049742]|uniref:hypothetical protein n=1 Tax=Dactylosporangium sp. NPDC049742 TaxID=3154737 RepID=UPI00344560BE